MIRLEKVPATDPAVVWLEERRRIFEQKLDAGTATKSDHEQYRADLVKVSIKRETFGKCAYCECDYQAVAWGDVEHILPKANKPRERTLNYFNLTLACSICNVTKSNKEYPPPYELLNPYVDNPAKFLLCNGPYLMPAIVPDEAYVRGAKMIADVGLNRAALVERRNKLLKDCHDVIRVHANAREDGIRWLARQQIADMRAPTAEFSMFANDFFSKFGL